jgi:hypothetical protein
MSLKQGSIVVINMFKQDASWEYITRIAELAYHIKNKIKTVRNNVDFPALLGYLQEELPLLAQAIAVGMREDMLNNPIRFIIDFTAVGDLISIIEYIQ